MSANFGHLEPLSSELCRLGKLAERYFSEDPNTALIKCRQFGELMAKDIAARSGMFETYQETTADLLGRLRTKGILPSEVADVFHANRKRGNSAAHDGTGTHSEALGAIRFCRSLGVWYRRTFGRDPNFTPGPFVPPPASNSLDENALKELEELRAQVRAAQQELVTAKSTLEEQTAARRAAEELAAQSAEESAVWEQTAVEQEASQAALKKQLAALQKQAAGNAPQLQLEFKQAGSTAAAKILLDERQTRRIIDAQLNDMGWEANSETLTHSKGARPEAARNKAIAEWPTESGPVDYALFVGLKCIGVIEAKKASVDVPAVLQQAERYAQDIVLQPDERLSEQWQYGLEKPFRVPFAFATNGRPFVRQWQVKSGIWFRDVRRETNHAKPLPAWFAPEDLLKTLAVDVDTANRGLADAAFGAGQLRPYQEDAIRAIETTLADDKPSALVSMATGTGKTRTAMALMYRLLKHKRFRRMLFLVDRRSLATQTKDALDTTEIEGFLNFSQIYKVTPSDQRVPEDDECVQVATVQSLINRINERDPDERITPGTFDCIIVDEAHRGYTLDGEVSDDNVSSGLIDEYQSAYRQVLDYFDAVKIALTATPALHTREIFGHPVFHYGYRQAVVEGYLTDHLPPKRITTALAEAGIHFEGGEEVEIIDTHTGQIDLFELPDEVSRDYDLAQFNKKVYSEAFNEVVCRAIAAEIPPSQPGKTLIFAARDAHADDVVRLLKQALVDEYGSAAVPEGMVVKITGNATVDDPELLIRKFKADPLPKYVVTVDLLTTGIDVPSICNLVFMRRVKSRILYDQMIGRATRLCPDIGKTHFRIFDAVDLYAELQEMSDMRPVVVKPNIPLGQLINELMHAQSEEDRNWVAGQIVVRLRARAKNFDEKQRETFSTLTGKSSDEVIATLARSSGEELATWISANPQAIQLLDSAKSKAGTGEGIWISDHEDELLRIEEIFGKNTTPEDYITGFEKFIKENMNQAPALIAVTQKPRDLTRKELSELAALLDTNNYSEAMLRAAYGRARNADIAAHIIGFVRQAALGDALVPYEKRVENAIIKIEKSQKWSPKQRLWLTRIGRALRDKPVADPTLLDQLPAFAEKGGFKRISKEFDGQLDEILHSINEAIWATPAA